jgi:hypothetical protein
VFEKLGAALISKWESGAENNDQIQWQNNRLIIPCNIPLILPLIFPSNIPL